MHPSSAFWFVYDVDLLAANDTIIYTQEQVVESLKGYMNSRELGLWVSRGALLAPQNH